MAGDGTVAPDILALQGDPEYGAHLASECVICHRPGGADGKIPAIAGLPVQAFVQAMHDYKAKQRTHPIMELIAGRLTNEEIAALAAYFETIEE